MNKRATLPSQRAHETRRRILKAAYEVFVERGYVRATVDEIAAAAGVSKGALYHHFAGKGDLLRAISDQHRQAPVQPAANQDPTLSLRASIGRFVASWLAHLRDDRSVGLLFMEFWVDALRDPMLRPSVETSLREPRDFVSRVIRAWQRRGLARTDLDVYSAAAVITAVFDGILLHWLAASDASDQQMTEESLVNFIERFLRPDPSSPRHASQVAAPPT